MKDYLKLEPFAARRIVLRPLSAIELRQALDKLQSEDAPNGRSVSSALAGLKGFALGVTNGIGGALLYDVATSEQGTQYLSNLYSSVSDYIGSAGSSSGSNSDSDSGTAQQVCFDSRSVDGDLLEQARRSGALQEIEEDDDDEQQLAGDYEYDYADDEVELEAEPEPQLGQVRQMDLDSIRRSFTCIVLNRGRALVRHRRSLPAKL